MQRIIFLFLLIVSLFSSQVLYSQTGTSPFTLTTELVSMPTAPAIHSFAFAQANGKWLFIGGRFNGLHGFFGSSFEPSYENKKMWVVDPVSGQSWSENLFSFMSIPKSDPLRAMNMEYIQVGDKLYMMGGFGLDSLKDSLVTFNVVSVIDVSAAIQAVINGTSPNANIRQLTDERVRVCGGGVENLNGYFLLAGGQNFWGDYTKFGLNNQIYSNKIKIFKINDNGTAVSITNYSESTDTVNFHRRDFNLVSSIKSDGSFGITLYGGVFQYNNNIPYQNPIYIDLSSTTVDTSYQQLMSQYTTAHIVLYDSLSHNLHTTFLGGTSLYYYNIPTQSLVRDDQVPFIKDITTLTKNQAGTSSEFIHPMHFDYYVGTNAQFIIDPSVPVYDNGIIKLQSLQGPTLAGYMFGGILADNPNLATTGPSDKVYKIYITKNPIGIQSIGTEIPSKYSLYQNYPNPFNPSTKINFDIPKSGFINLTIYDMLGRKVSELVNGYYNAGKYVTEWNAGNYSSGVYIYKLISYPSDRSERSDGFSETRRMILIK